MQAFYSRKSARCRIGPAECEVDSREVHVCIYVLGPAFDGETLDVPGRDFPIRLRCGSLFRTICFQRLPW